MSTTSDTVRGAAPLGSAKQPAKRAKICPPADSGRRIFSSRREPIVTILRAPADARGAAARLAADAELARRAANGERDAMQAVVTRLMPRVDHVTRLLFKNRPGAADARQSTLVEVLQSVGRYRPIASLESWADRITARVSYRMLNAQRRYGPQDEGVEPDQPASSAGPQLTEEVARPVWEYLERLPDVLREVLVLRHVLEHGIEEIAEMTQTSPNTVKDRLLRARAKMSQAIRRDRNVGVHR